jgi:hypothetical protein
VIVKVPDAVIPRGTIIKTPVAIIKTSGKAIAKGKVVDSNHPIVTIFGRKAIAAIAIAAIIETFPEGSTLGILLALMATAVIEGVRRWNARGCELFGSRKEREDALGGVHADGHPPIADASAVEGGKDVVGRAEVVEGGKAKPARCAIQRASDLTKCRIPDPRNLLPEAVGVELVWKIPNVDRVNQRTADRARVVHSTKYRSSLWDRG